jgi:hypothetical protein
MGIFIFGYFKYLSYLCEMDNKLEHIVIKYLDEFYGNLDKHKLDDFSSSIFYAKNGIVYLEEDNECHRLWIDFNSIWLDLETIFGLEEDNFKPIVYKWAKKTYNIQDLVIRCYFRRTLVPKENTFEVYL